jgi:RHS repeat-associated protein
MTTLTTINDAGQTISVERFYAAAFTPHKKVTYTYYPSGLVHTTTPDGGATVTMEYDLQGRRTKLTDPDAGETTTEYSAFGDIIKESRKKGSKYNVTDYTYSADGLLIQKVINNSLLQNYKYYYDDNIKGRLKIKAKCAQHNVHYYYDDNNKNYDRVLKIDETVGVKTYTTSYTYDQYGRKLTETFPTGYTTTNHYDGYGNMTQITDGKKRTVWEAITENERGQLTEVNKNGITQRFAYDNAGRTTGIKAYKAIPNPGSMPSIDWLVQMEYGYTTEGNLDYRKEFRDGNSQEYQRENFAYDDFNRLTSWAITKANASTPALTHSITYDPTTGNITNKSDVGSINLQYTNATKPHQLTGIDGVPAGVPTNDLVITYTDFDKVTKIQQNPKGASDTYKTYDITYGVDDQRITSSYSINFASQVKTTYLGNFEEEYDAVNKTYKKTHYLHGAILIQNYAADGTTLTSEQYYSTVSDFQGSLIALVDEQGAVAERYAFDPWGARRNPDDWTQTDSRTSWITHRGYTGHEHIDVFGVINMNGRVYDPMTAIFFSPDPFVQSAGDWMNYNRYTYCLNNPLKYTDPSGELIWLIPAAILLFTDVGYDIQKAFSPVAVHIDLSFGSHSNGIGLDVSVGIPQLAPISYRYDVGATYYFNRPGGYGSGWQVRNGAEWGLGFGFFQYGGMRYRDWNSDGLQADQVVHTAQIGTPLINASYSNDTEDSFPWAKYVPLIPKLKDGQIPRLDSDRYRTASGRLRVGLFELGFFLHTGEGTRISVTDGTRHFAGGNIDDPDRSNGIIYFGFGPFKMGWDSEKNRNALQNRLAHDGLSGQPQYGWRYPWVLMLDRSSRFVFQFGNF